MIIHSYSIGYGYSTNLNNLDLGWIFVLALVYDEPKLHWFIFGISKAHWIN